MRGTFNLVNLAGLALLVGRFAYRNLHAKSH